MFFFGNELCFHTGVARCFTVPAAAMCFDRSGGRFVETSQSVTSAPHASCYTKELKYDPAAAARLYLSSDISSFLLLTL